MTLYSEVNKGTTVSLYLPRSQADGEAGKETVDDDAIPMATNSELVLVVEDNPDVREVTMQRVEGLGYVVLEAASGPEAIERIRSISDLKLVFSDVVMPGGMSGFDLAQWAAEHRPGLPVLLTSGFAEGANVQSGTAAGTKRHILHKPYSRTVLARALRDALTRQTG